MKNILRKVGKKVLKSLAQQSIKKHNIKIYIILGRYGTEYAREATYNFIKPWCNVRRNISPIKWDLSVPLNIIGVEDRSRNILSWLILAIKIKFQLLFIKPYPHCLILDLDTSIKDIAEYWAEFVKPKALLVLKHDKKELLLKNLLNGLKDQKGVLIYNPKVVEIINKLNDINVFEYGSHKGVDLHCKISKSKIEFNYKEINSRIEIKNLPKVFKELIISALALNLAVGGSIENAEEIYSFELHPSVVNKALINIRDFVEVEKKKGREKK